MIAASYVIRHDANAPFRLPQVVPILGYFIFSSDHSGLIIPLKFPTRKIFRKASTGCALIIEE